MGLSFFKRLGDKVKKGDVLAEIIYHKHQEEEAQRIADNMCVDTVFISKLEPKNIPNLIDKVIKNI